ncbi:hypothetical protein [Pendulispora albinea]|uniref:Uncharacterized protein n=1 Tax=Pendulispora albinea TaxID=2741071 RepID=A0ABZ2LKQ8_9BACT
MKPNTPGRLFAELTSVAMAAENQGEPFAEYRAEIYKAISEYTTQTATPFLVNALERELEGGRIALYELLSRRADEDAYKASGDDRELVARTVRMLREECIKVDRTWLRGASPAFSKSLEALIAR